MGKSIMVLGTMSNVGKSYLTAALCRIFHQDGFTVAPFKAQNMALNSGITSNGLEMGRAQIMQAEACGIEPDVRMNPILLKPTSDVGSQVIVNGEVVENLRAVQYYARKKQWIPEIEKSFHSLSDEFDIVVLEGAGSPAEINLKQDDIVNMNMAKMADAPVVLVGDIDCGGVFAQLVGTVQLLEEGERARIKGLIINKFRGDVSILEPGLKQLEDILHIPVLGVIPYLHLDIDEEDSLSRRLQVDESTCLEGSVTIAVIRFPHISNFTDFMPLEAEAGVNLYYVTDIKSFGNPDCVIIPGSKNTMADLEWMRKNGLEATVKKYVANGGLVFGICGGYQMLGTKLTDPAHVEQGGEMRGMELLPLVTVFTEEKHREQISGQVRVECGEKWNQAHVSGYEMHMGVTQTVELSQNDTIGQPFLNLGDHEDGWANENVYGTYLHGLFDSDSFREQFLTQIYEKKGISREQSVRNWQEYREQQYDLLAEAVRNSLDMNKIYEIVGVTQ